MLVDKRLCLTECQKVNVGQNDLSHERSRLAIRMKPQRRCRTSTPSSKVQRPLYRSDWKRSLSHSIHEDARKHDKYSLREGLRKDLRILSPGEWYRLTKRQIEVCPLGRELSEKFQGNVLQIAQHVYPEYQWTPWMFVQEGCFFAEDADILDQRSMYNWLISLDPKNKKFQLKRMEDWHSLSWEHVLYSHRAVRRMISSQYGGSVVKYLQQVAPEFEWLPWQFQWLFSHDKYWKDVESQREYFDWIARRHDIQHPNDWQRVGLEQIQKSGGSRFLNHYNGSLYRALSTVYPSMNWKSFQKTPASSLSQTHYKDIKNQRLYFDWLEKEFQIKSKEDWYKIKKSDIESKPGGAGILGYYRGSMSTALEAIYPHHEWYPWLFERSRRRYWDDPENIKKFMRWMAQRLGITSEHEWYRVANDQFTTYGGYSLLLKPGLLKVLQLTYPHYQWKKELLSTSITASSPNFNTNNNNNNNNQEIDGLSYSTHSNQNQAISKAQWVLYKMLENMLCSDPARISKEDIQMNYHYVLPNSKEKLELDIYIPSLALAFEYQGRHHYQTSMLFGTTDVYQARDREKRLHCQELGITLIEIPYWWDYTARSLASTLRQVRPELVPLNIDYGEPIPNQPPIRNSHSRQTRKLRPYLERN